MVTLHVYKNNIYFDIMLQVKWIPPQIKLKVMLQLIVNTLLKKAKWKNILESCYMTPKIDTVGCEKNSFMQKGFLSVLSVTYVSLNFAG